MQIKTALQYHWSCNINQYSNADHDSVRAAAALLQIQMYSNEAEHTANLQKSEATLNISTRRPTIFETDENQRMQ